MAIAPLHQGIHLACDFDVIVLGAGISGLVSAAVLAEQGCKRILVVDEYNHIGGNHIDWSSGDYTFDVGSFIFQDDSPLLRHFPELLPLYVPILPTFGRLNPQRVVTKYPFSVKDDLFSAGPLEFSRIIMSVGFARLFQSKQTDARSFARFWIGDRLLQRSGLEHYMERFYGVPARQIDLDFAQKRMLWIKEHSMVANHVRRFLSPPAPPTNQQLARPKEGFAHLYGAAKARLEARGVTFMLGDKPRAIGKTDDAFYLERGAQRYTAPRIVSTIPIAATEELCGLPSADTLSTVTMISLFFSFAGARGFPHSVLFNFSNAGAWKRLTMHSDFYGRAGGREYFGVEVNAGAVGDSIELAEEDFRRHAAANGLFDGDLKLEGSNLLKTAYPIYTNDARVRAAKAIARLKAFGIESFGRQGGFDYQPTARVSTLVAEAALASQADARDSASA